MLNKADNVFSFFPGVDRYRGLETSAGASLHEPRPHRRSQGVHWMPVMGPFYPMRPPAGGFGVLCAGSARN